MDDQSRASFRALPIYESNKFRTLLWSSDYFLCLPEKKSSRPNDNLVVATKNRFLRIFRGWY